MLTKNIFLYRKWLSFCYIELVNNLTTFFLYKSIDWLIWFHKKIIYSFPIWFLHTFSSSFHFIFVFWINENYNRKFHNQKCNKKSEENDENLKDERKWKIEFQSRCVFSLNEIVKFRMNLRHFEQSSSFSWKFDFLLY